MNKAQKIIIAIALLIMAFILIYPPVGRMLGGEGVKLILPQGRSLIFSLNSRQQINVTNLVAELMAVVFFSGALVVLFGLKRKS